MLPCHCHALLQCDRSQSLFSRRARSMALPPRPCLHHLLLLFLFLFLRVIMLASAASSSGRQPLLHRDPLDLDRIVKDSAFHSYHVDHHRTAVVYSVPLPPLLAGATAETVRFRVGSLRRYGARIKEFSIAPGTFVHPHFKRLIVVVQNLGNLSSAYDGLASASGYRFVTPVLGIRFYAAATFRRPSSSNQSELGVLVTRRPMTVNFSGLVEGSLQGARRPLCALFDPTTRNLSLWNQTRGDVCSARRQGHFALVVEAGSEGGEREAKQRGWKVVLVSVVASAFAGALLGLVLVAVVSAKRKRSWTSEMERRAYEDEALQISIVGHVRAPTAPAARTAPMLENGYVPTF